MNEHAEFMHTMLAKIDEMKVQMASGRRGRLLAQSLVAAPAGTVGAILLRVIKSLCLDERKAIQAHFVAFRR